MPDYDRQLIAVFGDGSTYDGVIMRNAEEFHTKAVRNNLLSKVVKVPAGVRLAVSVDGAQPVRHDLGKNYGLNFKASYKRPIRFKKLHEALDELTKDSRLYLQGHGDWNQ